MKIIRYALAVGLCATPTQLVGQAVRCTGNDCTALVQEVVRWVVRHADVTPTDVVMDAENIGSRYGPSGRIQVIPEAVYRDVAAASGLHLAARKDVLICEEGQLALLVCSLSVGKVFLSLPAPRPSADGNTLVQYVTITRTNPATKKLDREVHSLTVTKRGIGWQIVRAELIAAT